MKRFNNRNIILYSFLLVILSGLLCIDRINFVIDDAFISLRYVYNIISGYGPVLNPGEHLEAISNPTWVWLLAGVSSLCNISDLLPLYYLSKIVGGILFIISGIVFYRFLASLLKNEAYAFFISLIYCLNPYIVAYSINGMENPLIYFLLITILYFNHKYLNDQKVIWVILSGLFLGILSISRPEGIIYIAAYFASIAIVIFYKIFSFKKSDILISLIISLSIFILFELWRWQYYEEFVPITVYSKNYFSIGAFKSNIKYYFLFLAYGVGIYAAYFILSNTFSFRKLSNVNKVIFIFTAVIFAAHMLFILYAGDDWMPGSRLLLLLIPCFAILLSLIIADSVSVIRNKNLFYTILCISIFTNLYIERENLRPVLTGFKFENILKGFDKDIEFASKLKEISNPGDRVLVNDLGTISFFNPQLNFVDTYGLSDKHIAKDLKGKHGNRNDPDYLLNLNCDYYVLVGATDIASVNKFLENVSNNVIDDSNYNLRSHSKYDLYWHKDFSKKYKPVVIHKCGIIFKNISVSK
jgi:arabinofuranosyltransferase